MPPPRSAATCVQCRARKVRCSGGAPCCSNCERLEYACSFAASQRGQGENASSPQLEKRRRPLACTPCRATKSKCTGERPSCAPCRTRSKDCVYPDAKRRKSRAESEHERSNGTQSLPGDHDTAQPSQRIPIQAQSYSDVAQDQHSGQSPPNPLTDPAATSETSYAESFSVEMASPSVGSSRAGHDTISTGEALTESWQSSASNISINDPAPSNCALPRVHEQFQIINDYFRHIYPHPGSAFLSEVSVTKRCLDGTIDEALLLAICAYTASVLRYPRYHPAQSMAWVQKAEDLLWHSMESPTVFKTQALLLAVLCRVEMGNFKRGYMLLSMASRSASALRLQYERLDLDHHSQEVRRRLTWSIMLIDNYFSVGLPESGTCPPDFIYLKMPCPEEHFHGDGGAGGPPPLPLDGVSESGLLQLYIRLSIIRRDILRLTRNLSLQSNVTPQITGLVEGMLKSLQLAEPTPYKVDELQRYANSRWLMRYVSVQLGWHQCHCDIYRLFLSGYREAAPDAMIWACTPEYVAQATASCLRHAQAVLDIIHDTDNLKVRFISPPRDICIGGYHASRLLLFISGMKLIPQDENVTVERAISLAKSTLTILRPLFGTSAMLGKTVEELDRIITAHVSGSPEQPPGDSSYGDLGEPRRRRPQYGMTIQKHTSLGVHSALRLAQFHDDEEDARGIGTNSNTHTDSIHGSATNTTRSTTLPSGNATQTALLSGPEDADVDTARGQAIYAAADRAGEIVSWGTAPETMDLSAFNLNIWYARGWQHDFSPGSSHDCI
ncbi:hypothetical protein PGQ11_009430 [Apiospora arundinis]|uniref:Zn(2)-C6 fungal-type domain-containing protein n=1 Tax=Apiospora arundinis TaxID=335852 RepID=A0ABR2IJ53_9PEZI